MKAKALAAAALSLCLLAAAGCGGKKAKTPRDAVKNYVNALLKGDKDLFLSSVHYGEADKELVEAQFEMMAVMMDFMTKFKKVYGTGKFKGAKTAVTEEELEKLKIEASGDTAVARSPSGGEEMKLVKKDGTWYVDITGDMPPGKDAEKEKEALALITKGIKKAAGNIGKEGYDAEKVMGELGAAFVAAAMSAGGG